MTILSNTMKSKKIVKVSKTEFELEDGTICPIPFELDEVPSVEEFQKVYDEWLQVFHDKKLVETNEPEMR